MKLKWLVKAKHEDQGYLLSEIIEAKTKHLARLEFISKHKNYIIIAVL
tara:strand:+ start:308 stop:451 length:144 start_codon:yes stop_codon:yes gene_type:complete